MRKLVTGLILGLSCWAGTTVSHATNYALCTGLNEYSDPGNDLDGCVPDAKNVYTNIILRGEWKSANATLLTNSQGTFAAVSNKLMSFASSAVSGDVVLYYQSSHGYQSSGKNTGICMYDKNMSDSNFAKILANFKSGVKVVIVLDTCHSGGMFKSARRDGTAELSSPFAFAQRVNEELAAIRADEAARGIRTAAKLAVLDCAWITAADYDQYSWDGDDGGKFTVCFVGSVKSGACDKSPYGNGDSYATFQEMFDYAVAQDITHGNGKPGTDDYTMPQCTNTTVLAAVTFGWVGKEEPGGLRFEPIPEQAAIVGQPLDYTIVATNRDGSTGAITYTVASSTAPSSSYSLNASSGAFSFTAPTDGSFTFDFVGTNTTAHTGGKASMTVTATLAAPSGLANSGITPSSFTASWNATAGATSYLLDVASTAFGAKAAGDDVLLNEDFSGFTGTAADRSTTLDTYLSGTGWTGSKVFENAGSAKLGSSSYNGWIATPELDLSSGGTVSFLLTQYGSDANTVTVSIISGDQENEIGTATPGTAETVEFTIPAASEATSVKIETSAKRAVIDDLVVTGGSAADVLAGQEVAGTSFTVEGLNTDTYYWRVRAVGNAKGPFSETMEVTLQSDPSAPPTIRAIDDIAIDVGETATAEVKVSAPEEAPVTSLEITAGDATAKLSEGVFSFAPEAPGTYDFTITAVNANGNATVDFSVIATLADPETPETPAEVDSDSFTAVWEAIPGAASYELVVIEGQGGSSGGGGGSGAVLTETFDGAEFSSTTTTYTDQSIKADLGTWSATQCQKGTNLPARPVFRYTGTLTSPSIAAGVAKVELDYSWPYNESATADIDLYVNGTKKGSASLVGGTAGTATYDAFDAVSGAATIEFRNMATSAQKFRVSADQVRITTASAKSIAKVAGDVIFSNNVGNVTSYEVTGLQSSTEYTFAFRAIAENGETTDWSAPVTVKTDDGPAAPVWSTIPAQTASIGYAFSIDLSGYVTGSPAPTLTLTSGDASFDGAVLFFTPAAADTYTFTVNAHNDSGDAAVTITVTAVDHVPTKYAVCVGINEYDDISGLEGCVNDSKFMEQSLIERGGWAAENVVRLNDSQATKAAIRGAIAAVAAKAVAGDTFVYQHSSHGGQFNADPDDEDAPPITDDTGKATFLCVYDENYYDNTTAYNDYEIAADLAAFSAGVKVVVIVDACHSGGLFKSKEAAKAAAASFDLAGRVTAIMDADRVARRARGEDVAKTLASSEIGWATAAEYYEYSYDGGFYHTDEWLTNPAYGDEYYNETTGQYNYPSSYKQGGVFLASSIWNWWNGDADTDGDGFVDAHEFWQKGYDFCSVIGEFWYDDAQYNYYPQCTNVDVLKSVELGYAGTPTLDAPVAAEAANVTASSFTASWSGVDDATGYRIQVATDPSFSTGAASDTLGVDDLAATGTSYTDFSDLSKNSGAVYAGTSAKSSSGAIQLNDKKNAGIWTTASGGNISRVAVEWNGGTVDGRTITVYGSGSPLTSYAAVKAATSLGTIVCGTSTELAVEGSYAYVGFITSGGALYLDSVTFDWGTAGSGSTIVLDQDVGNVNSYEVTGLDEETDYWYRVQALGDPVDSDFSNVIALTTESGTPSAPVWSAIPDQTSVAGEDLVIDLKPYVTGSPKPTVTADAGTVENGVLTVSFADPGDHTVHLTAENSEGSDTATLSVTVTPAPVTVPTLTLDNATSEGFDASWTACDGVTEYQLQVATDDQFTTGSAGGVFTLVDSADKLIPGDYVILAADTDNAMNNVCSGDSSGNMGYTAVTVSDSTISTEDASIIWTLAGDASSCTLFNANARKFVNPATARACGWSETASGSWTLSVSDGVVSAANASSTTWKLQYNTSSPRFAMYEGSQKNLRFFRRGDKSVAKDDGSLVLDTTTSDLAYTVTGLDPETTYYARVKGAADWSEVQSIATLADVPTAPAWSEIPPQTVVSGETLTIDLKPYVSGSPAPVIYADGLEVEGGVFTYTGGEAGTTATIELVARNDVDSASTTLSIAVTAAPVTVPVLTLSNPTANSFDASWTACDDVTSYTLEVSKAEFKGVRDGTALLSEDFGKCDGSDTTGQEITSKLDDFTVMSGWSGSKVFEGVGRLKLGTGSANGWVATPALDIPAGAVLTCKVAKYGNDTGTVTINLIADGTTNVLREAFSPVSDGETVTVNFTSAYAGAKVQFISSAKRFYLDDVVISGEGGGGGEDVMTFTVADTFKTVDGLDPDTLYYARVKGAADWSEVQSITTLSATPTAPVWLELPEQTATVDEEFTIDLSAYVTGSPFPAITVDGEETVNGVWTHTFAEAKTFTCALVAENSEGSAEATLTIVVSAPPVDVPTLALSDATENSFVASWTDCGVESYTLQIALDDQFTTGGGSGGEGGVSTETFANAVFSTTSSSYTDQTITGGDLGTWTATSCRGDASAPIVRGTGTLTSPEIASGVAAVEFDYSWPYGDTGNCALDLMVNGTKVSSVSVPAEKGTSGTASFPAFTAVSGVSTIQFVNNGAADKMRISIDQIRITGAAKSAKDGEGSLVKELTVEGTSTTVDGLDPDTLYYARVKGAADWSAVESIRTLSGGEPVQADIDGITISGGNFSFAVPEGATVMYTTNLVTGAWVAYSGEPVDGQMVIPMDDFGSAFFRVGEPPAGE